MSSLKEKEKTSCNHKEPTQNQYCQINSFFPNRFPKLIDQSIDVDIVYLDFLSKAFDKSHDGSLAKFRIFMVTSHLGKIFPIEHSWGLFSTSYYLAFFFFFYQSVIWIKILIRSLSNLQVVKERRDS